MKAIIRKTGEIVEIISYSGNSNRNDVLDCVSYIDSKGVEHPREKLNFYWDFEKIEDSSKRLYCQPEVNWQQVKIQAAIGAMQALISKESGGYVAGYTTLDLAERAVVYANSLVVVLREKDVNV